VARLLRSPRSPTALLTFDPLCQKALGRERQRWPVVTVTSLQLPQILQSSQTSLFYPAMAHNVAGRGIPLSTRLASQGDSLCLRLEQVASAKETRPRTQALAGVKPYALGLAVGVASSRGGVAKLSAPSSRSNAATFAETSPGAWQRRWRRSKEAKTTKLKCKSANEAASLRGLRHQLARRAPGPGPILFPFLQVAPPHGLKGKRVFNLPSRRR